MDATDKSKEGQTQLLIEYGSQHGQLQIHVLEINSLILPAVKRLGISHVYVKSHLLSEKTKEILKTKGSVKGFFLPDACKEFKRKTEEVKLTLSCHDTTAHLDEARKGNEKPRKNRLRMALQKQRERFRLRRNSDKVKTVVNADGEENGRATLSFERPLYYPTVSLYQLQTHSLHLTICGRNVTTTRSYPIATTCIPLMIAIKQHHPTWYQLCYNPDLTTNTCQQESTTLVQDSWEKLEGGTYTGRNLAWDMNDPKDSTQDNWLHKRKDYSRYLQPKRRKQPAANPAPVTKTNSLQNNSTRNAHDRLRRPHEHREETSHHKKPFESHRHQLNQADSGADLDKIGTRQDSIEELYFESYEEADTGRSNHNVYASGFRKPQKQWTSEFVICAPQMDTKRNSNNLDLSSLSLHGSLNRKTFGETIRGF